MFKRALKMTFGQWRSSRHPQVGASELVRSTGASARKCITTSHCYRGAQYWREVLKHVGGTTEGTQNPQMLSLGSAIPCRVAAVKCNEENSVSALVATWCMGKVSWKSPHFISLRPSLTLPSQSGRRTTITSFPGNSGASPAVI